LNSEIMGGAPSMRAIETPPGPPPLFLVSVREWGEKKLWDPRPRKGLDRRAHVESWQATPQLRGWKEKEQSARSTAAVENNQPAFLGCGVGGRVRGLRRPSLDARS